MSRESRTSVFAALATLALLGAAGCSSLPTAPRVDDTSAQAGGSAEPALLSPTTAQSASSTKLIYGAFGGRVSAGGFTVVIPPMAISGTATVRVTQRDVTKPYVSLEILPQSANKFRVPVLLIANAAPLSEARLSAAYISRFNPATGKWERMGTSSFSLLDHTVSATLSHFSEYAVQVDGKAGW